jgi:hypothetical protein
MKGDFALGEKRAKIQLEFSLLKGLLLAKRLLSTQPSNAPAAEI